MKQLLVAFGDSWTFGSELDIPREDPWPTHLAAQLNAECVNLGTPASSIEHTVVQLFNFIKDIDQYHNYKKIFAVGLTGTTRYLTYSNRLQEFVNITPEANYRTGDIHFSGRPPDVVPEFNTLSGEMYRMVECPEYNNFKVQQTIFTFENYCKNNNIDVVFFSYFDKPNIVDRLLYPNTITQALTGKEYELPATRNNQYFSGKLFHPNILGHIRIADLLKEFYVQTYC